MRAEFAETSLRSIVRLRHLVVDSRPFKYSREASASTIIQSSTLPDIGTLSIRNVTLVSWIVLAEILLDRGVLPRRSRVDVREASTTGIRECIIGEVDKNGAFGLLYSVTYCDLCSADGRNVWTAGEVVWVEDRAVLAFIFRSFETAVGAAVSWEASYTEVPRGREDGGTL